MVVKWSACSPSTPTDDPSLNPADAYSFSVKFLFGKNENKLKEEVGLANFLK